MAVKSDEGVAEWEIDSAAGLSGTAELSSTAAEVESEQGKGERRFGGLGCCLYRTWERSGAAGG